MFSFSKFVNSKVIKDIATASANDNFVIIAQKPNKTPVKSSFCFVKLATSAWIDDGNAISAPKHIPVKKQIRVKYIKSPSFKNGTKINALIAIIIDKIQVVFFDNLFEIFIQIGKVTIALKKYIIKNRPVLSSKTKIYFTKNKNKVAGRAFAKLLNKKAKNSLFWFG